MRKNFPLIVFLAAVISAGFCATVSPYWVEPRTCAFITGGFAFVMFLVCLSVVSDAWTEPKNYIVRIGEGREAVFPAYSKVEALALAAEAYPNLDINLSEVRAA